MRMRFRNLAASARPSSQNVADGSDIEASADASLGEIVTSLRGTNPNEPSEAAGEEWIVLDEDQTPPAAIGAPAPQPDQDTSLKRRSLLRRKTG